MSAMNSMSLMTPTPLSLALPGPPKLQLSPISDLPPRRVPVSRIGSTRPAPPSYSVWRKRSLKSRAVGSTSEDTPQPTDRTVYQGVYGAWTVEDSDVREVILYRLGLVTAAASFVAAASSAFLPGDFFLLDVVRGNINVLSLLGASGLGLSLYLIHIYVTPIKRALQALYLLGVIGSLATYFVLAEPSGRDLACYVVDNPSAVWLVGPLFASLTGLVFKEGLCYGKLEAGVLTLIIPCVLLGHLTGFMDESVKINLLGVWMALFVVFAGRKFTQPIKDDIGDKSVFMFNDMTEDEKAALVEKLEEQRLKS